MTLIFAQYYGYLFSQMNVRINLSSSKNSPVIFIQILKNLFFFRIIFMLNFLVVV